MSETPIQAKDDAIWQGPFWWRNPANPQYGCEECDRLLTWLNDGSPSERKITGIDEWVKHLSLKHAPRKPRTGNGTYQGAWAFTLTMSPKDGLSVGDMITAVRKLMRQKSCPVVRYAWHYEDKGRDINGDPIHPHIHGMYETTTGGRIEAKHFKRAWSIWDEKKPMGAGFRGGYHRPVRSEERYDDYMSKDGGMGESWPVDDNRTE